MLVLLAGRSFLMIIICILFLMLLGGILANSQTSLYYAAMGLELWFQKMIPSLLPFMILSGIMVRMELTEKASLIIYPIVKPLYKVRKNVCYAMLMGFLCGFPMGARVVDDLYMRQMITKREAEYLLAFCNNIGPVYFCSFVLPLLERKLVFPYLFGMYGIPLLYGLALRYTRFRDLPCPENSLSGKIVPKPDFARRKTIRETAHKADLVCCEADSETDLISRKAAPRQISFGERLLEETDNAIHASVQSILSLGGYMILFNLLNLIPHILSGHPLAVLSPLLEITGGLMMLGTSLPLYSFLVLSFGGLSCIAQTYSCIGDSGLSIGKYVFHKIILTLLNSMFYIGWFLLLPSSFLQ